MTSITFSGGKVVMKDGQVGAEQACCCKTCNVNGTEDNNGGESSGVKTYAYPFPSSERCVKIVFTVSSGGLTVNIGVYSGGPYTNIFSGYIYESQTLCLTKPDGYGMLEVAISGDSGSFWNYELSCDTCDCNPLP